MINLLAAAEAELSITNVKIKGSDTELCYPFGHQIHYDFEATKDGKEVFGWITVSNDDDFNITTDFHLMQKD